MDVEKFYRGLGDIFASGDLDGVSGYLRKSLFEARMEGDSHAAVSVLNEMIGYYRSISNDGEAIAASEQALEEMRRLGLESTADYGTTLLNAATAYRASGNSDKALDLYEEALSIYLSTLPGDDERLAGLYNNISALHQESGDQIRAVELLQKSAAIMGGKPGLEVDAATVYANLAQALFLVGREEEAISTLHTAMDIFEREAKGGRRPPHFAAALSVLAGVHFKMKDYVTAAKLYGDALVHIHDCYGENRDYAVTASNCATACKALGDLQKAIEYQEKADAVISRLNASGRAAG